MKGVRMEKGNEIWSNEIIYLMQKRRLELERLISEKQKALERAADGKLRVSRCNNQFQYYLRSEDDVPKWKYVRKSDLDNARVIAQRDYDEKVLEYARKEYVLVLSYLAFARATSLADVYGAFSAGRRVLISPVMESDDEFLRRWNAFSYEPMKIESDIVYETTGGVRVRSKSELMIAHALERNGVAFRYEMPLVLSGKQVRPDFVCLNLRTRKEYVWEHFGMMDNISYANNNVRKIELYGQNGYVLGKNLIATFESSMVPLSTRVVQQMIDEYLL